MPAVCNTLGVQFEYPENWTLEQYDDSAGGGAAVVSSPETAFWQLSRHPAGAETDLLFDEALAALRAEYKEIEAFAAADSVEGREIPGYDANFYCLDLTNTCRMRVVQTADATFLVASQAEDGEFQRVDTVFTAILTSLIRSLGTATAH